MHINGYFCSRAGRDINNNGVAWKARVGGVEEDVADIRSLNS